MTDATASVLQVEVDTALHQQRIDRVLVEATSLSRSQAVKLLKEEQVVLNGAIVTRPATKVAAGDQVRVTLALHNVGAEEPSAEAIPLTIVFEDEDILVVDKPSGMVIHPAPGHDSGTLVHAVLHHAPQIASLGDPERPGIVHRLDRGTSGLVIVAKSARAFEALQERFREQQVHRQYVAIAVRTSGQGLEAEGTIESLHGRASGDRRKYSGSEGTRQAITHFKTLEEFRYGAVLMQCQLQTGRTHQIRMHLSEHGLPILGDTLYGGRAVGSSALISRMALHAAEVGVVLPWMEERRFVSPLPADMTHVLDKLRKGANWR